MGNGGSRGRSRGSPPAGTTNKPKSSYAITSTTRPVAGVTYAESTPRGGDPRAALREMFGRDLIDREVMGLAGAGRGAEVRVRGMGGIVELVVKGPPARNSATGQRTPSSYRAERYLMRDHETGKPFVFNKNFFPNPKMAGQGLGAKMLATQVRAASRLGVMRLETEAARRDVATADKPRMDGYFRWLLMGYTGSVPASAQASLPASLGAIHNLSDLMQTLAGQAWWKEHGTSVRVTFDLTPGSYSRRTLNAYLVAHGQATI